MTDALRRRGGLALRLLVSIALFAVVLWYADVGEVADAFRDASWGWFAAALALMALATIVAGLRWRLLLEEADIRVGKLRAVRTFAASAFLNNVLPTSVGGDAVRTWLVGREGGRLVRAAAATITDRATALACLFLVAWGAVIVDDASVPASVVGVFAWVTVGLVAAGVVAALAAAGVRPVLRRLPERPKRLLRETWWTLRAWARSRSLVAWVLVLGLVYQALAVVVLILLGRTLGLELSFALAAVSAAVVLVAMLIPISIGGLGVREGGFVLLLGEAGIDAAEATSFSLLSVAVIVLASLGVFGAAAAYDVVSGDRRTRGAMGRRSAEQP